MKRTMARSPQRGFAYIAAVLLLVVVAGLCAAMIRMSTTQQATVSGALLGARAGLAARGGIEWGLFQLRSSGCEAERTLDDFVADSGFRVTVRCTASAFNEGEDSAGEPVRKTMVQLEAVACNGGGACPSTDPATVARPDYVERRRVATACTMGAAGLC
jgi:MSHA biogenesis protein MshP